MISACKLVLIKIITKKFNVLAWPPDPDFCQFTIDTKKYFSQKIRINQITMIFALTQRGRHGEQFIQSQISQRNSQPPFSLDRSSVAYAEGDIIFNEFAILTPPKAGR